MRGLGKVVTPQTRSAETFLDFLVYTLADERRGDERLLCLASRVVSGRVGTSPLAIGSATSVEIQSRSSSGRLYCHLQTGQAGGKRLRLGDSSTCAKVL